MTRKTEHNFSTEFSPRIAINIRNSVYFLMITSVLTTKFCSTGILSYVI